MASYSTDADLARSLNALGITAVSNNDVAIKAAAISKASGRIDEKITAAPLSLTLPLATPYPQGLVDVCADLACYYLAERLPSGPSERVRQRFLDAEARLEEYRTGRSSLAIQPAPAKTSIGICVSGSTRVFDSDLMVY